MSTKVGACPEAWMGMKVWVGTTAGRRSRLQASASPTSERAGTAARMRAAGAVAALLAAGLPLAAAAHELTPALLSLTERAPGTYEVVWRVPLEQARLARPEVVWPPGVQREGGAESARARVGDLEIERYRIRVPGGLGGRPLDLRAGSPGGKAGEALVRIASLDGRTVTGRIVPGRAAFVVPRAAGPLAVAGTYLRLGVEHILTGLDHLLFVLALTLLAASPAALIKTVTAFTVAHSLTLALASLGLVRVPPAPVEAVIALSIVFVARELWLLARGRPGLGARRPWPVAFAFGLLHGLGFAGALAQVGLPETDVPLALLTFNLGVEAGQLLFVALVLLAARLTSRSPLPGKLVAAYGIGALASFWVLDRVAAFFP
jgi:hydrogenase/urease accessory protein HupE